MGVGGDSAVQPHSVGGRRDTHTHTHRGTHTGTHTRMLRLSFSDLPLIIGDRMITYFFFFCVWGIIFGNYYRKLYSIIAGKLIAVMS